MHRHSAHLRLLALVLVVTGTLAGTVAPAAAVPPPNDALADAAAIAPLRPGGPAAPVVDNSEASLESGESAQNQSGCSVKANTVWYRYTPSRTGAITVHTYGPSNRDTVLNVWSGPSSDPTIESLVGVGCNDDINGGADSGSSVTWIPTAGTTYYVQVGTYVSAGPSGPGLITVRMTDVNPPDNDLVSDAEVLPTSPTVVSGTTFTDTTYATETPGEATPAAGSPTVWYAWTAPYAGTVRFRTIASDGGPGIDTFLYAFAGTTYTADAAIAADEASGAEGGLSTLGFPVSAGTVYRVLAGTYPDAAVPGATGPFALTWAYAAPTNDDRADARTIAGASGSVTGDNRFATPEAGDPPLADDDAGGHSVWYAWTAPSDGAEQFVTSVDPGGDTVLDVYTDDGTGDLTLVVEEDEGDPSNDHGSAVELETTVGTTYLVRVDGYDLATSGPFSLGWAPYEAPPTATTVVASSSGTQVSVGATVDAGSLPLPLGTMTYTEGDTLLGSAPVTDGEAEPFTTSLEPGAHTITGTFESAYFRQGPSSDSDTVLVTVATTTDLTATGSDPSPVLSALVTPTAGTLSPSGRVVFFDAGDPVRSVRVVNGAAVAGLVDVAPGAHTYSAVFLGDTGSGFLGSASDDARLDVVAATATTIAAVADEQRVTIDVGVGPTEGTSTPTGGVELLDGTRSIGTFPLVAGRLVRVLDGVAPGTHHYRAVYSPDAALFTPSASTATSTRVGRSVSRTIVRAPGTARAGSRPTIVVNVKVGRRRGAGTVTITLNRTPPRTLTLTSGRVVYSLPRLTRTGRNTVKVRYPGSASVKPSGVTATITVTKR